jgi:hypothetical protein
MQPIVKGVAHVVLASLCLLAAAASQTRLTPAYTDTQFHILQCGGVGQSCCRPPVTPSADLGPVVACKVGLGCDIATNTCITPCGGPGQVCCDGPETRAVKWTPDGRIYSPNWFGMVEMCESGGCDIQSHRCFACGTREGAACCPPDAAQATARCFGHNMSCGFTNDSGTQGICTLCGVRFRPQCEDGCDNPLKIRNGVCDICGAEWQPPCDEGCDPGLDRAQGLCRYCGANGQITCDRGCNQGTVPVGGICRTCGNGGQPTCIGGHCNYGFTPVAGICHPCGAEWQRPCGTRCNYPMKVANDVCRFCGAKGQIPCDVVRCNHGLTVIGGLCSTPGQPSQCALAGDRCVLSAYPGTHCCAGSGAPLKCMWSNDGNRCRSCVPSGQACTPGNQVCCSDGEICIFDAGDPNGVCGLPDLPDD